VLEAQKTVGGAFRTLWVLLHLRLIHELQSYFLGGKVSALQRASDSLVVLCFQVSQVLSRAKMGDEQDLL
jgi:hypothetical protein